MLSLPAILAFLLAVSCLTTSEENQPASTKSESTKPAVPAFLPGAEVVIEATFGLPPGYEFGEDPAVVYTFEPKVVEKCPFTVSRRRWEFSRDELRVEPTEKGERTRQPARLTVRVKQDAAYGDHLLPATLRVDFCSEEQGFCTWTELPVEFRIRVGTGEQALRKGTLNVHTDLNEAALLGD